jgi:hypothetical protein
MIASACCTAAWRFSPALHALAEVVDGVEIDVGQLRDLGLDVARHREVDHEHRPAAARLQRALDGAQPDDRQRARGARDDGVELVQPLRQVGQAQRLRAEAAGELLAALERAVGHRHAARLARREVRGDQLDHLAGADEEHVQLAQVLEQLAGQPHGRGRHADRMRADLGGGAHLLGHREAALEQLVQRRAERAGFVGQAHRLLHLAEDLRLAEHHRIEAGGDAEGVPRRVAVVLDVGVLLQMLGADAALFGQPVERRLDDRRRRRGAHREVQLGQAEGDDAHMAIVDFGPFPALAAACCRP